MFISTTVANAVYPVVATSRIEPVCGYMYPRRDLSYLCTGNTTVDYDDTTYNQ